MRNKQLRNKRPRNKHLRNNRLRNKRPRNNRLRNKWPWNRRLRNNRPRKRLPERNPSSKKKNSRLPGFFPMRNPWRSGRIKNVQVKNKAFGKNFPKADCFLAVQFSLICRFCCRKLRSTMGTSGSINGDLTEAVRTFLSGRRCRSFFFPSKRSKFVYCF